MESDYQEEIAKLLAEEGIPKKIAHSITDRFGCERFYIRGLSSQEAALELVEEVLVERRLAREWNLAEPLY